MDITAANTLHLTVTITELRLICKALGGRLTDDDTVAAQELDRQIAAYRIAMAAQHYKDMMKLKHNLEQHEAEQGGQV